MQQEYTPGVLQCNKAINQELYACYCPWHWSLVAANFLLRRPVVLMCMPVLRSLRFKSGCWQANASGVTLYPALRPWYPLRPPTAPRGRFGNAILWKWCAHPGGISKTYALSSPTAPVAEELAQTGYTSCWCAAPPGSTRCECFARDLSPACTTTHGLFCGHRSATALDDQAPGACASCALTSTCG